MYGPLEFADYLRRNTPPGDSATVRAARAAQPVATAPVNLLHVVSRPVTAPPASSVAGAEPVEVCEALAVSPPPRPGAPCMVRIAVATPRPMILVLSSHQAVHWQVAVAPGAGLRALLLSGFGQSMVVGARGVAVHRIGGFYAFKRGSAEFRHLESEVWRCTGHSIGQFRSLPAGDSLQLGPE